MSSSHHIHNDDYDRQVPNPAVHSSATSPRLFFKVAFNFSKIGLRLSSTNPFLTKKIGPRRGIQDFDSENARVRIILSK